MIHIEAELRGVAYLAENGKTVIAAEGTAGAYGLNGSYSGSVKIGGFRFSDTQGGDLWEVHILAANLGTFYDHRKAAFVAEVGCGTLVWGVGKETKLIFEFDIP